MSSGGWNVLGNAVNVVTCLQFLKEGIKDMYDRWWTAGRRLAEVKRMLDCCEELLQQMRVKDPLLGRVIEKRYPGFLVMFEKDIRKARARHDAFQERIRVASWSEADIPWSELIEDIEGLRDRVDDMYHDKLHTSNAIRTDEPVYTEMYDSFYQDPPELTPLALDRKLDLLHRQHQLLVTEFSGYPEIGVATKTDGTRTSRSASDTDAISLKQMPGALPLP